MQMGLLQTNLKNVILDFHNEKRNLIAGGGEEQPQAANMRELTWDPQLATRAQE